MKIAGTYTFTASRDEVWAAINDPEVLARSIPGCQKLDQVGENEFESTLKIGLQAVKGVYSGRVRIDDIQAPEHYRLTVDGKGNNGFMKGSGTIDLVEDADGSHTHLKYAGDAQVGGTIASVGQRLIDGASKTLINQSLKALALQIETRKNGGVQAEESSTQSAVAAPADSAADGGTQSNGSTKNTKAATETKTVASDEKLDAKTQNEDPFVSEAAMLGEDAAASITKGSPASETATSAKDLPSTTVPAQTTTSPPPATTTMLSSNPMPPSPKPPTEESSSFQARSIVVPEHERLSEAAVVQGVVTDFLSERPWLPWVVVAFVLGFLFGRRN